MKSQTPRTDSQLQHPIDFGIAVDVNFARKIERELTAETESRKAGDRRIADDQKFIAALQEKITHLEAALAAMPNDQKLSHAADDFRKPKTRSDKRKE